MTGNLACVSELSRSVRRPAVQRSSQDVRCRMQAIRTTLLEVQGRIADVITSGCPVGIQSDQPTGAPATNNLESDLLI